MRIVRPSLALFLSLSMLLIAPAAVAAPAAPHVADQAALDNAVADTLSRTDADRAAIRQVLERQEVRDVAQRAGIDVSRAESALATLDGDELARIADHARAVETSLAGGDRISLDTTTIIIILLVVIAVALIAD